MYQVLIVDDHRLVRSGLRRLLEDVGHISVVGEAESGEDAIRLMKTCTPDVVLMDINMPGMGGMEATRRLLQAYPQIKIIVLSIFDAKPFPTSLMQVGAAGYLTKSCGISEIVNAIDAVCRGGRYISADVAPQLALALLPGTEESSLKKLSLRELQVLLMVVQGRNVQEISSNLYLSPKTVSTYRVRLFDKLAVQNDVELTHLAMRHGLIPVGL